MIFLDFYSGLMDGVENYFEVVIDYVTDDFYNTNEYWIDESESCWNMINKCYDKDLEPEHCARLIERTYNIYYKNVKL